MKKLLSILSAIVLLMACIPLGAVSVSAATSGTTGDCTWDYNSTTKTLTVSGSGTAYTVAAWRDLEKEVVVFEEGVTYVGGNSFIYTYGDVGVLVIPSTLTNCGSETFMCGANTVILNSEAIAEKATTYDAAGYLFFQNTTVLVADSITSMGGYITNGKTYTESVSVCGKLYRAYSKHSHDFTDAPADRFNGLYCKDCFMPKDNAPTTLTYKIADGEVTITGYTDELPADLVIPATIEGYPVTQIGGWAFEDCSSLTAVTIPDSVTTLGMYAFFRCTGLTEVTIPDGVTTIGDSAFSGCTGLTEVTIPDGVTTIGTWAFSNCTGLTEVTIPDGVTTIGTCAFSGCTGLTEVTIPANVTTIGDGAFRGIQTAIVVDSNNDAYSSENGVLFNKSKTILFQHPQRKGDMYTYFIPDSVTTIGMGAFLGCSGLTEVIIPNSVTTIETNAFSNCTNLTEVTIPDGVTTIDEYSFYFCTGLRKLTIPDDVTTIAWSAFYCCVKLTDVYYDGTEEDRANMTIDSYNDPILNATWHYHDHVYDHDFDVDCNDCGGFRAVNTPIVFGGNSVSEDVSGLAFKFDVDVLDMTANDTVAIYDGATIHGYKLIAIGSIVSNDISTIDIPCVYLCDLEPDSCGFAVRIINIPTDKYDVAITATPYVVLEIDGVATTIYGEAQTSTYNNASIG